MRNNQSAQQASLLGPLLLLAAPVILALLVALFIGPGQTQAQAPAGVVVRCEPVVAAGPADQPLNVDIYVENVPDDPDDKEDGLYGADVRLSFDTTIAQIVDADPNTPDTQIQPLDGFLKPDFVARRVGDNVTGQIWYAANQIYPTPPATGSGALARITFQPQQAGYFDMPITYHLFSTKGGDEFYGEVIDCGVLFYDPDLITYLPVALNMN